MSLLKEYQTKRRAIVSELETVDARLKKVLNDSDLENSRIVVELQIERLALLDQLRFLRPSSKKDITYRQNAFQFFPAWARENIADEDCLAFHGTTLANTERILSSGRIISGKDRWSIHTSGDDAGEISVATKDFLGVSMKRHMDLIETYRDYERFVPAGCLFVLNIDQKEYQLAKDQLQIHNVQLKKNPKILHAVITTPENINRVKWWMQKNDFDPQKACDFETFRNKFEENKLFFSLLKNGHQKNNF